MKARMRRLSVSIDSATDHNQSSHHRECHASDSKTEGVTESRIDRVKKLLSSPLSRRKSAGGSHAGIGFASFGSFSTSTTSYTSSNSSSKSASGDFKTFGCPLSVIANADAPPPVHVPVVITPVTSSSSSSSTTTGVVKSASVVEDKTMGRRMSCSGPTPLPVKEAGIPFIVCRLCTFIETNSGLYQEGLFRISGNVKLVDKLKHQFDDTGDALLEDVGDVPSAAALLKLFLRELPDPVVPSHLNQPFFDAVRDYAVHERDGIERMRALVAVLPVENFFVLKYLCSFLYKVAQNEARNRMNSSSLGIVFGPNIFRLSAEDYRDFKEQAISAPNQIVSIFITDHEFIFDTEVVSRLRQDSLSSLLTTTLSQDSKPSTPPRTKSGSLLGLNRHRKSSGPPTLLNSSHIIPILILNNEALPPYLRSRAFPSKSSSFSRKRRESKLLGADIGLPCRSASEERPTDRDNSLEDFVDMRRCNSSEEVSSLNPHHQAVSPALSSGAVETSSLFLPCNQASPPSTSNSSISCSSGGNRLFSPSRVITEVISELSSVCPTEPKRKYSSPENSIAITLLETSEANNSSEEYVRESSPSPHFARVTRWMSQDKEYQKPENNECRLKVFDERDEQEEDKNTSVMKQDTLTAEQEGFGHNRRRRLSAIATSKMAQFQSDKWKCVDEDDMPSDVELNNNDLTKRRDNDEPSTRTSEQKESEQKDDQQDNDMNDEVVSKNNSGTIVVVMEGPTNVINQEDKRSDARTFDKKQNDMKDTMEEIDADEGSSKDISPSDESSDPMTSLPLPVISTEHRYSWPRESSKCDSVMPSTPDKTSSNEGNNTYSHLFASFPIVPQRSTCLLDPNIPGRRCCSSVTIEREAPVSPSAFRNYLSNRGKRLSDPSVVPSPPLEGKDFPSCSLKDRFLSVKEIKKRMNILKKALKDWEIQFERRTGRKASNEDKSSSHSVRPLLLEMIRLRRSLKESLLSGGQEEDTEYDRDEGFFGRSKKRSRHRCHDDSKALFLPLDINSATSSNCLKEQNKATLKQLEEWLKEMLTELENKRIVSKRTPEIESMTQQEILEEKLDLQKALLRFESLHGRPNSKLERDVMRPVYDRYRSVKRMAVRMIHSSQSSSSKEVTSSTDLQPIFEHVVMSFPTSSSDPSNTGSLETNKGSSFGSSSEETVTELMPRETIASTSQDQPSIEQNLHELPLMELLDRMRESRSEKKQLRRLIKTFEEDFTRRQGRKVEKDDRIQFEPVYTNYKHIKGRLRLLEALVSKSEKEQYKPLNVTP